MLQLFIQWLPSEVGSASLLVAIVGAVLGAVLWLSGARFSRLLVGLVTVAVGATAGMLMPRYFGWTVSGAGPAVGLALAAGLSGYVMHRFWIGVGLGLVLAAWACLATWAFLKAPAVFVWPAVDPNADINAYLTALWNALPTNVAQTLPYVCGAALLAGLVTTIFWPRLAIAATWSTAGVSLLAAMGSAAIEFGRPQWLRTIPASAAPQALALLALVAVGAAAQWRVARRVAGIAPSQQALPSK